MKKRLNGILKEMRCILILSMMLGCLKANAQQDTILTIYSNQTEITGKASVKLKDGFYIPAGKTVWIHTTGVSFKNCVPFAGVPSTNQNYISSRIFKMKGVNALNLDSARSTCEVNQTVQYFDGLGRSLQTVTTQGSPGFKDLIQPVAYDVYGREATKYLPYASNGIAGSYRADALSGATDYNDSGQKIFYGLTGQNYSTISSPYSQTVFESSPLDRVLEYGSPGDIWQPASSRTNLSGRTRVTEYGANAGEVKLWIVTSNGASSIAPYLAGKLYKTTTKDENWVLTNGKGGTVDEYKDFEGHVVLKRVWETDVKSLSTYYLYDDFGNLRYVMPPAVNENGQSTINSFIDNDVVFKSFIYGYRYDGRQRLIEKKIPGKEWERLVYNKLDQVVLTQDSILSKTKQWMYSKYDASGRIVSSGIYTNTTALSRAALQALVDGQILVDGQRMLWESRVGTDYTNVAFPQSGAEMQLVNYYDDYNILNLPYNQSANYSKKLKTLLTATKVKVLGTVGDYLWSVNYYDDEARVVKIYKQHYLGGVVNVNNYDEIENIYNFAGELTASNRIHHVGTTATTIANRYEYDHMGRKQATFEAINGGGEVVLNKLDYNEVGQLLKKSVHSTDGTVFTQNNTYAYNPRGWMTKVNNPDTITPNAIFGMELTYGDRVNSFNGNISGINWKTKVPAALGLTENKQSYVYDYDNLNRLIKAGYTTSGAADKFNEELSYDVMGNINTLKRTSGSTTYLNNFAYNYTNGTVKGNQLMGVTDAGTAAQSSNYQYDENGNQKSDSRKGLTLAYNMLNLLKTITKTSTGENLNYTYDATGQKLRKVLGSNTRDYISGIEYNNGTIEFIQTEEGRALPGSSYTYEYMLKDHLGNIRATVKQNGEIVQVQDYYAFGLEMNPGNSKSPSPNNLYRYNGKEKQTELSLDQLDYGARFYDPIIGRWVRSDNKAEKYESISPYAYAVNDPINAIDPDGNLIIFINGFVKEQWLRQDNDRFFGNGTPNSGYRPYPGSRSFTEGYPKYLGKSFNYWGEIDNAFMQGYRDKHALYVNGSSSNISRAEDRFSEGEIAGENLISQLDAGTVSLADGETIKIVGHSQGGAFAAGLASVLSKNNRYKSILQEVVYLEPHQPADFNHPSNVNGTQVSSKDDIVASKNAGYLLKGKTSYSKIKGVRRFIENETHEGDSLGGHSVGTNLDEIAKYFRSLGITVTVH